MDLMQLKAPPDRVALMADAIERDMDAHPDSAETAALAEVLAWLRYRLAIWAARRPETAQD